MKAERLRRTFKGRRFALLLVSVGLFAGAAPLVPAHAAPPSLSGEVLLGSNGTGASCQTSNPFLTYSISGTASGPYPGTFTESGSATYDSRADVLSLTARFTIDSSVGQVSGTKTATDMLSAGCSSIFGDFFVLRHDTTYTATIQTSVGTFSDQGETQAEMCGITTCQAGSGEWELTKGQFREEYGPDWLPPTVTPPLQTFPLGKKLRTTSIPVKVVWFANDFSGVPSREMQLSSDGGSTWLDVPLTNFVKYLDLAPGPTRYRIRVRATDGAGNTSAWVTGPVFSVNALQESDPAITYGGIWKGATDSTAYGGGLRYSGVANNTATLSVPAGTSDVAWVSTESSNRGQATVYVDGTLIKTIDLESPTLLNRQIVFSKRVSPSRAHTLQVHVLGTKNASSTGTRVDIDAFVTTG